MTETKAKDNEKTKKELKLAKKLSKNSEGKKAKSSKTRSVKTNIIGLVFISLVVAVAITMYVLISYSRTLVVDSAYGKMLNVVTSYGMLVDKSEDGDYKKLSNEEYAELLQDVTIEGISSANCFLVDKNGLIKYHADADRIGKPNKNKIITSVVGLINKGKRPDNLCTEYDDDGVDKYASFYITQAKSIIVMEARADELMQPIKDITNRAIVIAIIIIIVAMALTYIVVNNITNPLKQITEIINNTAQLKLGTDERLVKLGKRKDETGKISRAVSRMTDSLKDVVSKIDDANKGIEHDMHKLEESSNNVNVFCTDNSSTAEALAESTEEMNNMLKSISEHMLQMRSKSNDIAEVSEKNSEMSEEIAGRAKNLQITTNQAIERTRNIYSGLKEKTDSAVLGLKAVDKINDLTEAISEISDQTSLLALNASIEAARAGDAGRGFAVVATEISNLAAKSLENVKDINDIISEINVAVKNLSNAMEETSDFLEKNVLADYDGFNDIGDQYLKDADVFKVSMEKISEEINVLNESITEIVSGLENIEGTMSETSLGVNDIAEKTSNVVLATTDNYELTNNTVSRVDDLKQIVKRFEL